MPPPHEFSCRSGVIVVAVLIHASGIHLPQGKANWERTIDRFVDFRTGRVVAALAEWERAELEDLHPDGRAQFWGTHRFYTQRIASLALGDVVVFTGDKRVLAFGRIGLWADNPALGDALWRPHPKHGSYRHVYSLAPLHLVDMPQTDFRRRGGFGENDDFRGLRVLTGARAEDFVDAFDPEIPDPLPRRGTSPVERAFAETQAYQDADAAVAADLQHVVREMQIEVRSVGPTTVRSRAATTMNRGENLLVHAYAATLGPGVEAVRYVTPAGVTDLDVIGDGHHELVEAKSSAGRTYVRQALAQLLDYAPALGERRPDSLAALFPTRPGDDAIALLRRYGVTCIYRTEEGRFVRRDAPASAREGITRLW